MLISSILANPIALKGLPLSKQGETFIKKIQNLESWIDDLEKDLPPLKNFILPGGSLTSSYLHITRSVCRRAEREVVTVSKKVKILPEILIYLNRLSDLLYVLARWVNKKEKQKEIIWETE
jgi:cob(I)alamin adenosyltransferase